MGVVWVEALGIEAQWVVEDLAGEGSESGEMARGLGILGRDERCGVREMVVERM